MKPIEPEAPAQGHRAVWDACIRSALCAPSPDNTQPWRFEWRADAVTIRLDTSHTGRFLDAGGAFPMFSLGAVIENFAQTASALGHGLHADASDAAGRGVLVRLVPRVDTTRDLHLAIARRHTFRGALHPLENDDVLDDLQRDVAPGFKLRWVNQRREWAALATVMARAERLRFGNRTCHTEMHGALRFGAAEDGLPAGTLGITPTQAALLRMLRPWPLMRALRRLGGTRLMARESHRALRQCAGLGVLTQETGGSWLDAGRAFQQVWLAMVDAGITLQPWAVTVMLASTLDWERGPAFCAKERVEARQIVTDLHAALRDPRPPGTYRLAMLFRYGQCDPTPDQFTPRRPLATFIDT